MLLSEAADFRKTHPSAEERRWRALVEEVAREALSLLKRVHHPSPARLERAMQHPAVLREAKRRFENPEAVPWT
jgi:ribosome maturation protein Sdo1